MIDLTASVINFPRIQVTHRNVRSQRHQIQLIAIRGELSAKVVLFHITS